jgi:hypothetical protein
MAFTGDDAIYSSLQQWATPEQANLPIDLINYLSVELARTECPLGGRLSRFQHRNKILGVTVKQVREQLADTVIFKPITHV